MKYYPLNKKHPKPLYVQLGEIIKQNIYDGNLKENDPVPSESILMKAYEVSRLTVRNALVRLVFDGLIYKVHGRGSFVSSRRRLIEISSAAKSFREQAIDQGFSITRKMVEFTPVYPTDRTRERLCLENGVMVDKVKRLIRMENRNIGLDVMFVSRDVGRDLKGMDLSKTYLVDHFNKKPETRISKMDIVVWAAPIETVIAETMGVDNNNTVLVRASTYWTHSGRPIMDGHVYYLSQYSAISMTVDSEMRPLRVQVGDISQYNMNL